MKYVLTYESPADLEHGEHAEEERERRRDKEESRVAADELHFEPSVLPAGGLGPPAGPSTVQGRRPRKEPCADRPARPAMRRRKPAWQAASS